MRTPSIHLPMEGHASPLYFVQKPTMTPPATRFTAWAATNTPSQSSRREIETPGQDHHQTDSTWLMFRPRWLRCIAERLTSESCRFTMQGLLSRCNDIADRLRYPRRRNDGP